MGRTLFTCTTLMLRCQPCPSLAADDVCTPGKLRTDSTPHSISIEWACVSPEDIIFGCGYAALG